MVLFPSLAMVWIRQVAEFFAFLFLVVIILTYCSGNKNLFNLKVLCCFEIFFINKPKQI